MHKVLIAGAGKIGSLIACLLADSADYQVHIVDVNFNGADVKRVLKKFPAITSHILDVTNAAEMSAYIKTQHIQAVISSLPYFVNVHMAAVARQCNVHYFDLTEDTSVTENVKELAKDATMAFVPQCGLAPGFIGIVANTLMQHFDSLDAVKLRVGALPQNSNNALQYALTWSTEGVINEYGNPCHGIRKGKRSVLQPLEGLEEIQLNGQSYEAFNTSGGLGSLAEIYHGKVQTMNYKTIRFPGHCKKMRVLMNDLRLNEDRATLKRILENAIPKTYQDMVIIYVSVTGQKHGTFIEENYVKKMCPQEIAGLQWSAIQVTTASAICAVIDMILMDKNGKYHGLVYSENFLLDDFLANRFGRYYQ